MIQSRGNAPPYSSGQNGSEARTAAARIHLNNARQSTDAREHAAAEHMDVTWLYWLRACAIDDATWM